MDFVFEDQAVARAYDDILVPRLFDPWAQLLVEKAALAVNEAVLDLACGPGTVARLCAARVGPRGKVTAVDSSAVMLDVARSKLAVPNATPVEYVCSPAAPLAVPSDAFDVVLCNQGFQFFPDKPAALAEIRRALRKGGRLAMAVWASLDECRGQAVLVDVVREVAPDIADDMRAPWSFPDAAALEKALVKAGFREVKVEPRRLDLVFEGGIAQALASLQALPIAPRIAALPDAARVGLVAAAERHLSMMGDAGAVRGPMVANVATAVR